VRCALRVQFGYLSGFSPQESNSRVADRALNGIVMPFNVDRGGHTMPIANVSAITAGVILNEVNGGHVCAWPPSLRSV
jgi:hypothetical protein